MGLLAAMHEYAGGVADPFETYARRRVAEQMDSALQTEKAARREEEQLVADAQAFEAADLKLRRVLGRAATPEEIRLQLGWTPVSGRINADYDGRQSVVTLNNSYLSFPNGRIDLVGQLGRQAEVRLSSRNLEDFSPAIGFASSSASPPAFPIRGGMATLITRLRGPMNALQISGQASATNFAIGTLG